MVASIARALRLTQDERDHLFQLAGHVAPPRGHRSDHVSPALMRVLDRLDTPAQVISDLGVVLRQNPLAEALLGVDLTRPDAASSPLVHRPGRRAPLPAGRPRRRTRAATSRTCARSTAATDDAEAQELVDALLRRSAEFAALWERHEVAVRADTRKRIQHPRVGVIDARLPDPHRREPDGAARRLHRDPRHRGRRAARAALGGRRPGLGRSLSAPTGFARRWPRGHDESAAPCRAHRCGQRDGEADRGAAGGDRQVRNADDQAGLRRLDEAEPHGLEERAAAARDPADAAVRLHHRQELHRLGADHRRDGPAL